VRRTATRLTTKSAPLAKSALVGGAALAVGLITPLPCAAAADHAQWDQPSTPVVTLDRPPAPGTWRFALGDADADAHPHTNAHADAHAHAPAEDVHALHLAATGTGDLVALALLAVGLLAAGFFLTVGILQVARDE
jgi:hypothetical protein